MPLLHSPAWTVEVERGPNCLFVRLGGPTDGRADGSEVASLIWQAAEPHFVKHIVLDLSTIGHMRSALLGQLLLLHKRLHASGGTLRLCGLSDSSREAIHVSRLQSRLPEYENRHDAVMTGSWTVKPR